MELSPRPDEDDPFFFCDSFPSLSPSQFTILVLQKAFLQKEIDKRKRKEEQRSKEARLTPKKHARLVFLFPLFHLVIFGAIHITI